MNILIIIIYIYIENKSTVNDEWKNILENGTAVCLHVSPATIDNTVLEVSQQKTKWKSKIYISILEVHRTRRISSASILNRKKMKRETNIKKH